MYIDCSGLNSIGIEDGRMYTHAHIYANDISKQMY